MLREETLYFQGQAVHFSTARPDVRPEGCALMICGPGESALNWRRIVPEMLQKGFFCVVAELPGMEARRGENRNDNRAGVLWGVLDELDRRAGRMRTWHILAHGSGCAAALMMAAGQPDSVASLVLISPVLQAPVNRLALRLMESDYGRDMGIKWYRRNIASERGFADLAARAYGMRPSRGLLRELRQPLLRRGIAGSVVYVVREGYSLPENAFAPQCPTMVLRGGCDRYGRYGTKPIQGAEEHVLQAAAHCPAETHYRDVCDFLRGWYRMFM